MTVKITAGHYSQRE